MINSDTEQIELKARRNEHLKLYISYFSQTKMNVLQNACDVVKFTAERSSGYFNFIDPVRWNQQVQYICFKTN